MQIFSCVFFGHRDFYSHMSCESALKELISDLINKNEYTEFLVGRNGEFDRFVSSLIKLSADKYGCCNHAHVLVLPYETAEYRLNCEEFKHYYDEIEIFEASHYKTAITERNRYMIDRADLVVCYVNKVGGGAYKALCYARKRNKQIINLADKKSI